MTEYPIDLAITIFSGFTQESGDVANIGMVGLEDEVEALCRDMPTVRVRRYLWNANVEDIVENLWQHRRNGSQKHLIVGYSYGGDRAIKMCWALNRRNDVEVIELALCDGVRRWKWLPGVAASTGLGKLVVPPVVKLVWWYWQHNPRWSLRRGLDLFNPAGHSVVAADPKRTSILHPVVVSETHSYIDNSRSFRETFLESVKSVLEKMDLGVTK